ncbi:MAG: DegT/DnrJ/EryC1/StrS family aminotransferase [Anaerolineaceae bacterium]|nr:MAG: DegT/DnrJ/EryC1/StrS family aminotransferase [Anaerolineaceae bacterium]
MDWRVPLADIDFGEAEITAVTEVLRSRWLSMGAVTQQFEQEFAAFIGAKHTLAVTNATAALHLACLAIGLGPGDEVIIPSLTFVATANAVRYTGATPVFADVESHDWLNISPLSIEARLTAKTRAILVVHYAGFACDMSAIMEIARRHDLVVLEDSAHAIGSKLADRTLGTWGAIGCFSFFSNKNMTTGEGGMLATDDDALADRLRILRSHGMTSLSWDRHKGHASTYDVVDLGYNYRIDEMRSALGRVQLGKLPASNEHRGELTALYRELLSELTPAIIMPFAEDRGKSCCHILPVLLPPGLNRAQFMEGMKSQGIQTSIHYPPVHRFQIYEKDWSTRSSLLPLTEDVAARQVTLPLYATMQAEQVEWVVRAAGQVLKEM